ncbi:YkvA family protein [Ilumatobacter sp.]|uniref:YkvA family protein n=1 Tax=Ilumatobacter sp. TaxID=1967498 RepID=UPI00375103C0
MRTILVVLIGVVVTIGLMWLVLLACFAILRPPGSTLSDAVRIVPDTIRLVRRLAGDRSISRGVRVRLFVLLGYLAIPIDLVPDFIPVLGYADDAIVIGIVLRSVIRRAGPDAVRRHWPGSDDGLALLARLCRVPELQPERAT